MGVLLLYHTTAAWGASAVWSVCGGSQPLPNKGKNPFLVAGLHPDVFNGGGYVGSVDTAVISQQGG